jgi:hypothetical protein
MPNGKSKWSVNQKFNFANVLKTAIDKSFEKLAEGLNG